MSSALLGSESLVARRFDEAQARFKVSVDDRDYRLRAIVRQIDFSSHPLILDLGCGKGRFATRLMERGARVIGLDVSPGMLGNGLNFPRVLGSATRLPLVDGCLDAVIAVEVFQHVSVVDLALKEAFRTLRPGGRIILVDKNRFALNTLRPWLPNALIKWVDERRGRGMYGFFDRARERWFSPFAMCRLLTRAGFVGIESEGLIGPGEEGRSIFTSVPLARAMWLWTGRKPGATS